MESHAAFGSGAELISVQTTGVVPSSSKNENERTALEYINLKN
jgi:hypothetical protein